MCVWAKEYYANVSVLTFSHDITCSDMTRHSLLTLSALECVQDLSMTMFLGFVGLASILLLWPLFFLLHYTGLEVSAVCM